MVVTYSNSWRTWLKLASTSGDHNAANELTLKAAVLDLVVDVLDDFGHPGLDDAGDVAPGDLFGRASRQAWDHHDLVFGHFALKGRAELVLEGFGVLFETRRSLA